MKKILVLILTGCMLISMLCFTAIAEQVDETAELSEFVVGTTTPPTGAFFTGMWGDNTSDMDVRSMIHGYNTMVWTTQPSFTPDPYVVLNTYYTESDTGDRLYIIDIMDGLTYNDGTPITAKDYVFSLLLQSSKQIGELGASITGTSYIVGYDDFSSGVSEVFSGVRVFDDLTFGIEIRAEYLPFFFELGMLDVTPYPISVIAPGCEVADDGNGAYIRNAGQSVAEPIFTSELLKQTIMDPDTGYLSHPSVTSGPYKLVSYKRETGEARFEINPYYRGNHEDKRPTIDNVVLVAVNTQTMISELQNGNVQLLNKVVASDSILEGMKLVSSGDASMANYLRMGFGFVNFSCEQGPAQFEAVRKAIAYSLDLDEYINRFLGGFGAPVYGYYGLGQWMVRVINGEKDQIQIDMEQEQAAWDALSINSLNNYELDADTAKQLLVDDGWTLNEAGDPYKEGVDAVRFKNVDGELMGLTLRLAKAEGSTATDILAGLLTEPLGEIGISIAIVEMSFSEMIRQYYRQDERTVDMMVLATNFNRIFDPSNAYSSEEMYQGIQNTTGIKDEKLEELAYELRSTEPGNELEYCQKWLEFQQRWNEVLPMLPLYSNLYFDFYSPNLYSYTASSEQGWPEALLSAYYSTAVPEDELPFDDGEDQGLIEEEISAADDEIDFGDDDLVFMDD